MKYGPIRNPDRAENNNWAGHNDAPHAKSETSYLITEFRLIALLGMKKAPCRLTAISQ